MKFTIYHGFLLSIILHSAGVLPFVLHVWTSPPDDTINLVLDIQGITSDTQQEQKQETQMKGEQKPPVDAEQAKPDETTSPVREADNRPADPDPNEEDSMPASTPAPPQPKQEAEPSKPPTASPTVAMNSGSGAQNIKDAEAEQQARMLSQRQEEALRQLAYAKAITKKIRSHLIDPDDGRHPVPRTATIAFTVLENGQINPDSLKVFKSSGEAKLDASALKTIRASLPFDPPPKEMNVKIPVDFGVKN